MSSIGRERLYVGLTLLIASCRLNFDDVSAADGGVDRDGDTATGNSGGGATSVMDATCTQSNNGGNGGLVITFP